MCGWLNVYMRTWLTPGHEYNICFSPESLVTKKNILSCQKVIKRLELHAYFKKKRYMDFTMDSTVI
jgi:hypothetical protein